jgi:hypothetical protein
LVPPFVSSELKMGDQQEGNEVPIMKEGRMKDKEIQEGDQDPIP